MQEVLLHQLFIMAIIIFVLIVLVMVGHFLSVRARAFIGTSLGLLLLLDFVELAQVLNDVGFVNFCIVMIIFMIVTLRIHHILYRMLPHVFGRNLILPLNLITTDIRARITGRVLSFCSCTREPFQWLALSQLLRSNRCTANQRLRSS